MNKVFIKTFEGKCLTFQVDLKNDKIQDLLTKYCQKVGRKNEQVRLVFAGKDLYGKQKLPLYQVNLMNQSTIFTVLRLNGGQLIKLIISTCNGKQTQIQFQDQKTGKQLKEYILKNLCQSLQVAQMALRYAGVQIEDNKKLSDYKIVQVTGVRKIFQQKIGLGKIAGIILAYQQDPFGMDEQTVRMSCGHVIGRDGMTAFIRSLIDAHQFVIRCPASKPNGQHCQQQWDFAICRKIGVFTKQQVSEFQIGLSKNWITRNSSQCPKCQQRVIKGELQHNRVKCPNCKYGDYCYQCSKKWNNTGFQFCGNNDCQSIYSVLKNCQWSVVFQLKIDGKKQLKNLPKFRICPSCSCLCKHQGGCKHMLCTYCKAAFCWACLKQKKQDWQCGGTFDYCGMIAQTQEIKKT